MSKAELITALIESAIENFSRHGYEGASLRAIAAQAGAQLSAINLYFGSKAELYDAVHHQVWVEVNRERVSLLQQAEAECSPPQVAALIRALIAPVVLRALSLSISDTARAELLRGAGFPRSGAPALSGEDVAQVMANRWIAAVRRAMPALSQEDAVDAFSFVLAIAYSGRLSKLHYNTLMGVGGDSDPAAITERLVAFCCGGIDAFASRSVTTP